MTAALEIAGFAINLLAILVEIVSGPAVPSTPPTITAPTQYERTLGPPLDALRAPEIVEP